MAQFEGYTGVDHIFAATDSTTDGEGSIFVRFVKGTKCTGTCTVIIAITEGKIPFVIRIEVLWMKGCQSGCTGTNFVEVR